jgi:hypothetical protein
MENVLRIVASITLSVLSLTAVFSYTVNNNDINRQAIAQEPIPKLPHPETAEQFANLIEGNDTAIILNDTDISDVNDTLLSSIGINIREGACMPLPNSTGLYCP